MKKIIHFLFILVFVLACKKGQQAVEVVIEDANYNKAISFFNQNNDSAFYYFNEVATNSKDSLHVATAYNYMAVIQADAGDYFGSIESLTRSLSFLDERKKEDSSCLASDYNELGLNNIHLGRYDESIRFYDLALKYATNKPYKLIVLNNKGYAYREKKNYTQAIKIFDEILAQNQLDKREYARSLTNMSFTKWLQNPNYKAATNFLRALHIREKEKDLWGQNSSYAHLADYYAKNKRDSALWYARKMYRVAKRLESPNDQIEALQKLIKLSASDSSKFYFDVYQQLNDSVQLARSAAKNQFALIRYEVEKNKADNLRLQKENAEKVYQINKQRTLTAVVVFLMVIFVICAIFWYKKRKQRLELEAQNQIKEHQLKTSKKVHDVVANGIYRVMAEIENQNQIDREGILNRLENMYEKSRDISYEAEESLVNQPFNEKIAVMLKSFATATTDIIIVKNEPDLWINLSEQIKYEIEHILQELMVNMKKHSQASLVAIRFEREDRNRIAIYYTDNGIGMPKNVRYNNGLKNTGNRIKSINGKIIFDAEVEKGLKIHISFPVS